MTRAEWIEMLRAAILADNPPVYLIIAACWLCADLPRWYEQEGSTPDWVRALAEGNPDLWEDVVYHVRAMIEAEARR